MILRRGQKFEMNGLRFKVVYVSDLRAHCVAVKTVSQFRLNRRTGEVRRFTVRRQVEIDVSPKAGVELLGEVGKVAQ